ncbi:transcription factor E2F8 [Poecilia formosa]|uniref:transcription factor E2F8 n=1 Tax=Poecilia formosa TaxID=48698 RepID=UPI0007B97627|nr:PREDICTED: transcription factor E2F8 [Poecilia formosa]
MGPFTTPKKRAEAGSVDPWTPTSNLKMLISAASPEIRNREKELCMDADDRDGLDPTQDSENGDESEKMVSRKDKSLGLLCHKFLARYPDYPDSVLTDICLDDVATELSVERRRIYDIMNSIPDNKSIHGDFKCSLSILSFFPASVNSRKDKSLRVMSQKFVMLFLVSNPHVVSLDVAAKILIGEDHVADQDKSKFKTKVRRLYDIANVLRSLKLIEKFHVTEAGGRKPAFKWIGPVELPPVQDLSKSSSEFPSQKKRVLEPSVENCAKNLFPSSGAKRSFTRHPSLIKLAKSIQDDRRKINSAPSSPTKCVLGDPANVDVPSKMAQLAAICKIKLDQESRPKETPAATERDPAAERLPPPASGHMDPPKVPLTAPSQEPGVHLTPRTPLAGQAAGAVTFIPTQCSPLIPVLLPQQRGNGPYAVYLHPSSLRSNALSRPQPTSLAVRSMTFEDKTGQSPSAPSAAKSRPASRESDGSPLTLKRQRSCSTAESSPSKARRPDPNFKDGSPKLGEILQARLKARRGAHLVSRPSPRALHLDPEFVNTPGGGGAAGPTLEHSLENLLDRDDRPVTSDLEAGFTPVRAVPLTPGQIHSETLVPAGYLIPISQQSLISYKELQNSGEESNKSSYIYQTPTAGSRSAAALEVTPTNLRLGKPLAAAVSSPHQPSRVSSPSPAILNFTLQNLGLISSPTGAFGSSQPPEGAGATPGPLGLQPRGLVFIKPVSPVQVQPALPGQPLTLISLQQPLMATPKASGLPQHSFFHTPVPLSPLAAMVTASGQPASRTVYVPQRKLDVSAEDS